MLPHLVYHVGVTTIRRGVFALLSCLTCVSLRSALEAEPLAPKPATVVLISLAPSPYTQRHDALRAGIGVLLFLRKISGAERLPIKGEFYDASTYYDDAARLRPILHRGDVVLVGGSTWAQGSSYLARKFFETVGGETLLGVSASAWATAGGEHTGGEIVVQDMLRSLMGMGAQVFTLGQKLPVFTTEERQGTPPGHFTLLDCWYMDQFARTISVVALARGDPELAKQIAAKIGRAHV